MGGILPYHNRHYSSVWIRSAATGSQTLWEAILDYRSGYRKLDVKRAIALKSVYAIRFYELFSGKTEPIIYPVAKLKEMFAIKDKYKQINDFVRKVIEPAKRELMRQHPIASTLNLSRMGEKSSHSNSRLCIILSEKTRMPKCVTYNGNCLFGISGDRHVRDYLKLHRIHRS